MKKGILASLVISSSLALGAPTNDKLNELYKTYYHSQFKIQWPMEAFAAGSGVAAIAEAIYHLHAPKLRANEGYSPNFYSLAGDNIKSLTYVEKCANEAWMAYNNGGHVYLCPSFLTQSVESRVSNLFHEASHSMATDPGHVTCERGRDKGKAQLCDETFQEKMAGSGYNHQFMYNWWVRDGSESHELSRASMDGIIHWLVMDKFNVITNTQVVKWTK